MFRRVRRCERCFGARSSRRRQIAPPAIHSKGAAILSKLRARDLHGPRSLRIVNPRRNCSYYPMITKNIGMLLLAIYLIIVGIVTLTGLGIGFITGALALVAGIFILIGR